MTASTTTTPNQAGKGMRIALWCVQVFLAIGFTVSGLQKLLTPIATLAAAAPWVATAPEALVRFIGACEVAGAIGLIAPSVSRIKPGLSALAAVGLATIMLLALAFHVSRGEFFMIPVVVVLGGLCVFVAWGRAKRAPIAPR